jgi:flagellar motility protein MotE (MotC chaperone)
MRPMRLAVIGFAFLAGSKIITLVTADPDTRPDGAGYLVSRAMASGSEEPEVSGSEGVAEKAGPEKENPILDATPVEPAPAPESCQMPEEMLALVRQERDLLDAQKNAITIRLDEIKVAEDTLAKEIAAFETLKADITSLIESLKGMAGEDLQRLVSLYANMKPQEAAIIMNDMDMDVTVAILSEMDERTAAPILAQLSPERARAISRIILERSKPPGDQRLGKISFN